MKISVDVFLERERRLEAKRMMGVKGGESEQADVFTYEIYSGVAEEPFTALAGG